MLQCCNMLVWLFISAMLVISQEWRDVLTEVGDNQSLVASLKQSPFHAQFKDEVMTWESKLSWLTEGLALLQQVCSLPASTPIAE
jgi:Dynein heavy chain, N-terminal region 2